MLHKCPTNSICKPCNSWTTLKIIQGHYKCHGDMIEDRSPTNRVTMNAIDYLTLLTLTNWWTDLASLHGGLFRSILHCIVEKFRYLQKKQNSYFPLELCLKFRTLKISPRHIEFRNLLSTLLGKDGRSGCAKLNRHQSAQLTVPATVDRLFITVIVKFCLQHHSVVLVH